MPNDLTPKEAAQIIKVSRNTMYRLLRTGKIASYRISGGGVSDGYRITREALDAFRRTKEANDA